MSQPDETPAESAKRKILHLLRRRGKKGVRVESLTRAARLNPTEADDLHDHLADLERLGIAVRRRNGRIALAASTNLVTGTLRLHRDGYGFLCTNESGENDYFVSRRAVSPAMDGDRVHVRLVRGRFGSPSARVVEVVERARNEIIGVYRGGTRLEPREENIPYTVSVAQGRAGDARDGDLVAGRIVTYPSTEEGIEVEIDTVLGRAGDPRVETESIVRKHQLPTTFPPDVLVEAAAIADNVQAADVENRVDLRHVPFVTIDGENARDFDDAVALAKRGAGLRLWVAIADVAHYVRPGSALDREAAERGTSVYFPDRVLPMLPEALSNGICSLRPDLDRLTLAVVLDYGRDGLLEAVDFHPSVIRSGARLTYGDLRGILVDRDEGSRECHAAHIAMLTEMEHLSRQLTERRRKRGSIDFDLPEPEIILDLTGRTENIVRAERHIGHRIIEEFMIAANTAVAQMLKEHDLPSLHRIHEPPEPDRIAELSRFLSGLGHPPLPVKPAPIDFQRIIAAVEGKPEERLVNTVLLRSMQQARYATEPLGHFGLATRSYTHFTSPIRRYPDLIVHRILRQQLLAGALNQRDRAEWRARLGPIAEHSSQRERLAMEAERECIDLKKVEFMQDKLGLDFEGYVSGVQRFGFFVELTAFFVEGLVHIATLSDDHYEHDERAHLLRGRYSGRIIRLGDAVRVRVVGVDVDHRRIDFACADTDFAMPPADRRGRTTRPSYARTSQRRRRRP